VYHAIGPKVFYYIFPFLLLFYLGGSFWLFLSNSLAFMLYNIEIQSGNTGYSST
jgi:hypothetical protein